MTAAPVMAARTLLIVLLAAVGLGACGKKGDVRAPDGEKNAYIYPQAYPAPSSVIPPAAKAKETESGVEEEPAEQKLEPRKKDRLSPFPLSPERSQSYGS